MNGCEQQWFVVVCVTLLTLFTVSGLPFRDQYNEFGINDDPAESQPLSLTERDASNDKFSPQAQSDSQGNDRNLRNSTTNSTVHGQVNSTAANSSALNSTTNIAIGKKKNLTASASPQNVRIFATPRTGNTLVPTSISYVNTKITPSYSIQNVTKKSRVVNVATYTSSKKPSFNQTPTVKSSKLSQIGSASINLKVNMSVIKTVKPTAGSAFPTNTPSSAQNTSVTQSALNASSKPFNKSAIPKPTTQSLMVSSTQNQTTQSSSNSSTTNRASKAPSAKAISSVLSNQSLSTAPSPLNSTGKPSTAASTNKPSTVASSGKPSTAPSTNKPSTAPLAGPASSPATTTTTTAKAETSEKVTTEIITLGSTRKPTTQTKLTQAKTNKEVKTESMPTKKTTAEKTEKKDENNDEGQMPPPDQGKEAVVWDFIVPVAIGTGVALLIAFAVVMVRACRRRKLIKVRFGGKPSHPRLLNNDLINLLAESDDEEE